MFVRGLAIGFAIAVPVGPIGLLCIRRSLESGLLAGLTSGLGAACADAVYAALAAFALSAVTRALAVAAGPLHVAGALALIVLGVRAVRESVRARTAQPQPRNGRGFAVTFGLTLANPATILSFAAIVAGAAFGARAPDPRAAWFLVGGVFAGSALWWAVLATAVGAFRHTIPARAVRALSIASGLALAGFGVALLA